MKSVLVIFLIALATMKVWLRHWLLGAGGHYTKGSKPVQCLSKAMETPQIISSITSFHNTTMSSFEELFSILLGPYYPCNNPVNNGSVTVIYASPGNVFPTHISLGMRVSLHTYH